MSDLKPGPEGPESAVHAQADLPGKIAEELGLDRATAEYVVEIVKASYSGPIPPVSEIAALNAIAEGLGTRLVEDHLTQREHLRFFEREGLALAKSRSVRKDGWLVYARRG